MTSTVTDISSLIDSSFPVPGVDNDTQGFRDNFGNIQTALARAAYEITDLQVINSALISLASTQPISLTGKDGDYIGQIYATTSSVYICTQSYNVTNTTTNIWSYIDVSRASNSLYYKPSAPATSTGTSGDVKGMVFANSTTLYVCYANYVNTTSNWANIWAKINTVGATW
jgi:hypothetical protein